MDREELGERYRKGRKNFTNLNLSGLNLAAIYMPCADLSGCNLSGADLGSANLEVANLSNANLAGANLRWSRLTRANLYQANLRSVNMTSVTLGSANLEEANLEGANLFFTRLYGTNLSGANLKNVDLRRSFLDKVILRNANLTGADLTGTNLQGSDLTGANLTDTKLDGVCWLEVQIDSPNVLPEKDALIWRISNQRVDDLRGIDLSNADLRQVDLQNLDLTAINLSKTNLLHANLAGANLNGANLAGANLARANFTHANLANANLVRVQLWKTDFRFANLQGIQFEGTSFLNSNLLNAVNVPSAILSTSLVPIDHPDIDLVSSLCAATEGLICNSEKDDPYEVFLWDTASKGEFTLEKLLRAMAYLSFTNFHDLQYVNSDTEQLVRAYEVLLQAIQARLLRIELYEFTTESLRDSSSVMPCIIIGRTLVGDWFGITTKISLESDMKTSEVFYTDDGAAAKAENQIFISTVEEIASEVNELLPNSEGAEGIIWALASSRDLMLQNLLLRTKHFAIKDIEGCEYLFQQDISEDTEQRELFAQLVLDNLHNLRVYFIGSANVDLYLIGQSQSQDWIGIRTGVTWT
jgi:uncharacterized protein YjbI with pentapeptide repeats